jgi:hypothetical protein
VSSTSVEGEQNQLLAQTLNFNTVGFNHQTYMWTCICITLLGLIIRRMCGHVSV